MNLPKYPAREPLPSVDRIQSLINEANSFDIGEFNKEALRLTGQWYQEVDEFVQSSSANLKQEVFLKLWQSDDELIAKKVLVASNLEVACINDTLIKVPTSTVFDLGMTAIEEDIGLVFITGEDRSEDVKDALFVHKSRTNKLRVLSHLFVGNK